MILVEQSEGLAKNNEAVVESLNRIKELGYRILEAVESGNLTDVGLFFDEHWKLRKRMSRKISNPRFDKIYEQAKANGALGGKLTGAGGGGFFLFYVEKGHTDFRMAMKAMGLREMHYRFDLEGTKVLANFASGVS